MSKTYEEYINSREEVTDLREHIDGFDYSDDPVAGFLYFDGFWIVDCNHTEMGYFVHITTDEQHFTTLAEAEQYLWDNWVKLEVQ